MTVKKKTRGKTLDVGLQIALFDCRISGQIFRQEYPYANRTIFRSESQDFSVCTASEPEFNSTTILYIRGDRRSANKKLIPKAFDSNTERDQFMKRVINTFIEWADSDDTFEFTHRDLGHTQLLMMTGSLS